MFNASVCLSLSPSVCLSVCLSLSLHLRRFELSPRWLRLPSHGPYCCSHFCGGLCFILLLPFLWGFVFGPCFVVQYFVLFPNLQSSHLGRVIAGCFNLIVLLISCGYWCSVALPSGAFSWSAVCDCVVFPRHTHFFK